MEKIEVTKGVYLLNIPKAGLSILCGCPPDVIKHLMRRGLISERPYKNGLFETGPNAILLSDLPLQGGKFANLAEFPILQMFYRQGMILPNHPGNTGMKPMVLGVSQQIRALSEYLFRGTYGLETLEEIKACGIQQDFAQEILRIKLWFAFNKIRKSEDLLDLRPLDSGREEIRPGLVVKRNGVNSYTFEMAGEKMEIDLNLAEGETYTSPVKLNYHRIRHEYFSVVHIGEGDGWDPFRPCMSSIIIYHGKIYLIDTGPNILDSLTALGISVNEIEGIFHTHAHDDHFAGLTSLVRTDHRIKYFATPLVRATVMKKLAAIMNQHEKRFLASFEIHDLKHNEWNNIEGLEVMPIFSPHPVETNVFFFRTMWESGYKSYSHLADIAAFDVLKRMLIDDKGAGELSEKLHKAFIHHVLKPMDIKKIDIGGGMIHGNAFDFAEDRSKKVMLAHIARELTPAEKDIGSIASFGQEDVLIPAHKDYVREQAERYLDEYFPQAARYDLDMLLNCPIVTFNSGYIFYKKGTHARNVYLIINGVAEVVQSDADLQYMLSAGTIIGELGALGGGPAERTYRAKSYVNALEIPGELYRPFIQRNADLEDVKRISSTILHLQTTWLFGEMVSSPILHRIARELKLKTVKKSARIENLTEPTLILIRKGSMDLLIEGKIVDKINEGDFLGEESIFFTGGNLMSAIAREESECYYIKGDQLRNVPILEWKMLESYERRLTSYGEQMR